MPEMELLETRVAASRLGVTERRARALARSGRLGARKVGGRWLIDAESVDRRRVTGSPPGRPVAPRTAWAILMRASGEQPAWAAALDRSGAARRACGPHLRKDDLARLRRRAQVRYFVGSPAAQDALRAHPRAVATGVSAAPALGADVVAPGIVEAYLPEAEAERTVRRFELRETDEARANVILRAASFWPFDGQRMAPRAAVAADLAESIDERRRRAGLRLLRAPRSRSRVGADVRSESDREWDSLTSTLLRYGVLHLAPGRVVEGRRPSARALFTRLARASQPRLRQAAVFLLLTHPDLAPAARAVARSLAGAEQDLAMRRYVAAAALQRMARTRIEERLGRQELIPPAFLDLLALPPLDDEHGARTLWELSRQEEARYGYDAWGTYQKVLELFLAESRRRKWGAR